MAFWVPLAIAVGAGATSYEKGKKAERAQIRANVAQGAINDISNQQAKREFMRRFRQNQAAQLTMGIARGAGLESSAVQASLASGEAQARTALAESDVMGALERRVQTQRTRAARNASNSAMWGQISQLAASFISLPTPSGVDPSAGLITPAQQSQFLSQGANLNMGAPLGDSTSLLLGK